MAATSLKTVIEQEQVVRLQVLHKAYEATLADSPASGILVLSEEGMAEALGLSLDSVKRAVSVLVDEDLAEYFGADAGFTLTVAGRNEVRQSVLSPGKGTEHFAPSVAQHVSQVFHGTVGAVQAGNHNTATVQQAVAVGNHDELRRQLAELRELVAQLPKTEKRDEADDILVEWVDAEQNNTKALTTKRVEREGRQLRNFFSLNNIANGASLVSSVVQLLLPLLTKP